MMSTVVVESYIYRQKIEFAAAVRRKGSDMSARDATARCVVHLTSEAYAYAYSSRQTTTNVRSPGMPTDCEYKMMRAEDQAGQPDGANPSSKRVPSRCENPSPVPDSHRDVGFAAVDYTT